MRGTQEVSVKSELKRRQMNTFLPRMTDLSCIDFHKSMQKTGEKCWKVLFAVNY